MQMLMNILCPLGMLAILGICIRSLPFNVDQIIDFMYDAIFGNNITSGDASVLNFWPTITSQFQIEIIDGLDQTNEWPIGTNDARTAKDVWKECIYDLWLMNVECKGGAEGGGRSSQGRRRAIRWT